MAQRSAAAAVSAGVSITDPVAPECAVAPGCPVAPYLTTGRSDARLFAALLLIAAAPLIAVLGMLIRLSSPGPVLFRQLRLGVNGRPFTMFKLRTMVDGAEGLRPGAWTRADDSRITWIGRHLRRWHVDELPQLFNVVRGEMALVGPRPERPEIAARLSLMVPDYEQRQQVLPGIVGLAQINLPPDTSLDCVRRKLQLDLEYIRTADRGLDLRMIAWSCARLLGVPFDLATDMLRLSRSVAADVEVGRLPDASTSA